MASTLRKRPAATIKREDEPEVILDSTGAPAHYQGQPLKGTDMACRSRIAEQEAIVNELIAQAEKQQKIYMPVLAALTFACVL